MINKLVLEPTDENLERFKRFNNGGIYWHTADFFKFDRNLEDKLSVIFESYVDLMMHFEDRDEDTETLKISLSIGRMIVKLAMEINMSPQDCRSHFNNYATIVFLPILIWTKEDSGEVSYSLKSGFSKSKS